MMPMAPTAFQLAQGRAAAEALFDTYLCALTFTGTDTGGRPGKPFSAAFHKARFNKSRRVPVIGQMSDSTGHVLSKWSVDYRWDVLLGKAAFIFNAQLFPARAFRGDWAIGTSYVAGDAVNFGGMPVFVALVDNVGVQPGTNDATWAKADLFKPSGDDREASWLLKQTMDLELVS